MSACRRCHDVPVDWIICHFSLPCALTLCSRPYLPPLTRHEVTACQSVSQCVWGIGQVDEGVLSCLIVISRVHIVHTLLHYYPPIHFYPSLHDSLWEGSDEYCWVFWRYVHVVQLPLSQTLSFPIGRRRSSACRRFPDPMPAARRSYARSFTSSFFNVKFSIAVQ